MLFDKKWVVYQRIQKLKNEGVNISNIAQIIGISRDTVYKYINMPEEDFLNYLKSLKKKKSVFDKAEKYIDETLERNKDIKIKKLYDMVVEKYSIKSSYRNFIEYINKKRNRD